MQRRPAKKSTSQPKNLSHDAIAREAFRIYQSRHGAPGDPVADWFEATRIVTGRSTTTAPRAAEAKASANSGGRRDSRHQRR